MKKFACVALMLFMGSAAWAGKSTSPATLQDVQPTNFPPAKKKHQQYDFSVQTAGKNYQCRTPDDKKIDATQFVVGSSITFISDGRNGEIKTAQGKSAKCTITRVADAATPAPAQ